MTPRCRRAHDYTSFAFMNDQNTLGNDILLEAIRPERKSGRFGWLCFSWKRRSKAEIKPPPLKEGTSLFLRTQSASGETRLSLLQSVDDPIAVAPNDWAMFLRVHTQPVPMTLAFPDVALDVKGRALDVILEGKWQVTEARTFLQSGAETQTLVRPDRRLRSSDLPSWIASRISHQVCADLAKETKGRTFEELHSARVSWPPWWQERLGEWLAELGVSAQLTDARLQCGEAGKAALREARKQSAEQDFQEAQDLVEQEIKQARTRAEADVALEAIKNQCAEYHIEADEKVDQSRRNAHKAQERDLLEIAKLVGQRVAAEQARLEREQKSGQDRERSTHEHKLKIERLQEQLQAIRLAQVEQADQHVHDAQLRAERRQWELEQFRKELETGSREKDLDRARRIHEAENRLKAAQRESEEASQTAKTTRDAAARPLENPCPHPHCYLDLSFGQTFKCAWDRKQKHVWHRSNWLPFLCTSCAQRVGGVLVALLVGVLTYYGLFLRPITLSWSGFGQRQVADGSWQYFELKDGMTLTGSNQFKLKFDVSRDCHAYVIAINSDGSVSRLFPEGDNAKVRAGVDYSLPEDPHWATLDNTPGTETLFLIASAWPKKDLAALARAELVAWAKDPVGMNTRNIELARSLKPGGATPSQATTRLSNGREVRQLKEALAARGTIVKRIQINHDAR